MSVHPFTPSPETQKAIDETKEEIRKQRHSMEPSTRERVHWLADKMVRGVCRCMVPSETECPEPKPEGCYYVEPSPSVEGLEDTFLEDAVWLIERGAVIREDWLDDYNQRCREFMARWKAKDIAFPNNSLENIERHLNASRAEKGLPPWHAEDEPPSVEGAEKQLLSVKNDNVELLQKLIRAECSCRKRDFIRDLLTDADAALTKLSQEREHWKERTRLCSKCVEKLEAQNGALSAQVQTLREALEGIAMRDRMLGELQEPRAAQEARAALGEA